LIPKKPDKKAAAQYLTRFVASWRVEMHNEKFLPSQIELPGREPLATAIEAQKDQNSRVPNGRKGPGAGSSSKRGRKDGSRTMGGNLTANETLTREFLRRGQNQMGGRKGRGKQYSLWRSYSREKR